MHFEIKLSILLPKFYSDSDTNVCKTVYTRAVLPRGPKNEVRKCWGARCRPFSKRAEYSVYGSKIRARPVVGNSLPNIVSIRIGRIDYRTLITRSRTVVSKIGISVIVIKIFINTNGTRGTPVGHVTATRLWSHNENIGGNNERATRKLSNWRQLRIVSVNDALSFRIHQVLRAFWLVWKLFPFGCRQSRADTANDRAYSEAGNERVKSQKSSSNVTFVLTELLDSLLFDSISRRFFFRILTRYQKFKVDFPTGPNPKQEGFF